MKMPSLIKISDGKKNTEVRITFWLEILVYLPLYQFWGININMLIMNINI